MPAKALTVQRLLDPETSPADIDFVGLCAAVAARVSASNGRPIRVDGEKAATIAKEVRGPNRMAELCEVRHTVAAALRRAGWTYQRIGQELDRDHTSIIHAVRRVETSARLLEIADEVGQRVLSDGATAGMHR